MEENEVQKEVAANKTPEIVTNKPPEEVAKAKPKAVKPKLNSDDAEYLQKYLRLCEKYLAGTFQLEEAQNKLNLLNRKFRDLVTPKTIRKRIAGSNLSTDDGWVPSQVCW